MESGIGRIGPGTAGAAPASTSRARGDGGSAEDADDAKLREACRELESVFLEILISEMRRTAPRDELFGGGRGEDMFDQEIAKKMAARGGIGLADVLYGQLKRMMGG